MSTQAKPQLRNYLLLHLLLLFNSLGGVCSKLAGREKFLSPRFILFYAGLLTVLLVYAICWQQIIRHMSLTTAFLNKSAGMVWTILWGVLIFHEQISLRMLLGAAVVLSGVVIVVTSDE